MLVFPECFMEILGGVPNVPRPFRSFDRERCTKLLQLAHLLLDTDQSEATRRTVNYLIRITSDETPAAVPRLRWLEQRIFGDMDALAMFDPNSTHPGQRLIPQMRFRALLGRG